MGKTFDAITAELAARIARQQLFFVSTAPSGSGAETVAHLPLVDPSVSPAGFRRRLAARGGVLGRSRARGPSPFAVR